MTIETLVIAPRNHWDWIKGMLLRTSLTETEFRQWMWPDWDDSRWEAFKAGEFGPSKVDTVFLNALKELMEETEFAVYVFSKQRRFFEAALALPSVPPMVSIILSLIPANGSRMKVLNEWSVNVLGKGSNYLQVMESEEKRDNRPGKMSTVVRRVLCQLALEHIKSVPETPDFVLTDTVSVSVTPLRVLDAKTVVTEFNAFCNKHKIARRRLVETLPHWSSVTYHAINHAFKRVLHEDRPVPSTFTQERLEALEMVTHSWTDADVQDYKKRGGRLSGVVYPPSESIVDVVVDMLCENAGVVIPEPEEEKEEESTPVAPIIQPVVQIQGVGNRTYEVTESVLIQRTYTVQSNSDVEAESAVAAGLVKPDNTTEGKKTLTSRRIDIQV